MRWWRRGGLGAALVLASTAARADPPPATDPAAAEVLFDQGRELWAAGRFAESCSKFAESHRLDPGLGVLLYLGDCYVKSGRTASAWAAFREVVPAARALGQLDRVRAAEEKLASLGAKLVKVNIVVPPGSRASGLEVRRDGVLVGEPLWGVDVPVDPGEHVVDARAPSKRAWATRVTAQDEGKVLTVTIPGLADEPPPAPSAAAPVATPSPQPPTPLVPDAPRESTALRTAGFALGAVGVAALVGAVITGALVMSERSKLEEHCPQKRCDADGLRAASSAETLGVENTVLWALSAAFVGTGIALVVVGGRETRPRSALAPALVNGGGGVRMRGAF